MRQARQEGFNDEDMNLKRETGRGRGGSEENEMSLRECERN